METAQYKSAIYYLLFIKQENKNKEQNTRTTLKLKEISFRVYPFATACAALSPSKGTVNQMIVQDYGWDWFNEGRFGCNIISVLIG